MAKLKEVFLDFIDFPKNVFREVELQLNEIISRVNLNSEPYDYVPVLGQSIDITIGYKKPKIIGVRNRKKVNVNLPSISLSGGAIIHIVDEALEVNSEDIIINAFEGDRVFHNKTLNLVRCEDYIGISIALYNNSVKDWYLMSYIPNDKGQKEKQIQNQEDIKDLLRILIAQSEFITEEEIKKEDLE